MQNIIARTGRSLLLSAIILGVWCESAGAQPTASDVAAGTVSAAPSPPDARTYELEKKKYELQEKQYELEKKKLAEQEHAALLTLATILVTAVLGFATVAYNLRNASKQAQIQAKLKAIDVVISAAGPNSARERLKVVSKLMGKDLVLETKPEELEAAGIGAGHDQNRKDLVKLLIEHPTRQLEILDMWQLLFAKTNLGQNLRDLRAQIEAKGQPKQ